jgi:hypothetical protein
MSYEEEDACHYEEEDAYDMSSEEDDTCHMTQHTYTDTYTYKRHLHTNL